MTASSSNPIPGISSGIDVFRVAQVGEGGEHGASLAFLELPVNVGQHVEQRLQLHESRRHEIGHVGAAHALQRVGRRGEDFLVVGDAARTGGFAGVRVESDAGLGPRVRSSILNGILSPVCERLLAWTRSGQTSSAVGCANALKCGTRRNIGGGDDRKSRRDDRGNRACVRGTPRCAHGAGRAVPAADQRRYRHRPRHDRRCTSRTRCSTSVARTAWVTKRSWRQTPGSIRGCRVTAPRS